MKRVLAWLRRPYDRCVVGNHRMGTKSGYWMCRKHGDVDEGPRHPGDEMDPTARVGWPAPLSGAYLDTRNGAIGPERSL